MIEPIAFSPSLSKEEMGCLLGSKINEIILKVNNMEAKTQPTTQAASSHPQMPPSCSRCCVAKPCELSYFSEKCFNRLRRHFLLA
jgi:hypothetical protein